MQDEQELSPEMAQEFEALMAEFTTELTRTDVDWDAARERVADLAPKSERVISEDEIELTIAMDMSGLLDTLRALPDGAGTAAFLTAYEQR